jgi:hypothetical protein
MVDVHYTHIEVLLDRTGSMQSIKSDMEGAYNQFIESQKSVPGRCTVSLHQFDSGSHWCIGSNRERCFGRNEDWYQTLYSLLPVKDVPNLILDPRGCTPLLDATGKMIDELGVQLCNLPENKRPGKVIVIIITDGQENDSHKLTVRDIRSRITHQQDIYNWQFVFLGANFDAVGEGLRLGLRADTSIQYAANTLGCAALSDSLADNITKYRMGAKCAVTFEREDFQKQKEASEK